MRSVLGDVIYSRDTLVADTHEYPDPQTLMIRNLIQRLILVGLILTPVFGLQYWLQILPGLDTYVTIGAQIIMIKAAKDVLLSAIFILFLLGVLGGRRISCDPLLSFMLTLLVVSFAVTASEYSPVLAVIGLRGLSPFLLVFVAYSYLDMPHIRSVVRVLVVLLLVESCGACVRAGYGSALHGLTYLGFAARPSGTFASPSSWSIFLCLIICYILGFDIHTFGRPRTKTWFFTAMSVLLILFAGSGAGLLAVATIMACWFLFFTKVHPYLKASILPLMVLASVAVFLSLPVLTGRPRILESAASRMGILSNVFLSPNLKELLIGRGLGIGSNVAVTFAKLNSLAPDAADAVFIADSLYASFMAQMGILFLGAFLILNVWVFRKALAARYSGVNPIILLAVPATLVGALGNVMTEVFPVNWLLFIMYGMALRRDVGRIREGPHHSPCS
jgi:hypothetical protein